MREKEAAIDDGRKKKAGTTGSRYPQRDKDMGATSQDAIQLKIAKTQKKLRKALEKAIEHATRSDSFLILTMRRDVVVLICSEGGVCGLARHQRLLKDRCPCSQLGIAL